MRPLLPFLLLCAPAFGQSDCTPLDTTGVVNVKNATVADLSARAKSWFASTYTNSKAMVQRRDDSTRIVVGTGMSEYPVKNGGYVSYTVEITCKYGGYTYKVHTLKHDNADDGDKATASANVVPTYGSIYDCPMCCELHKTLAKEQPASVAKNAKQCEKEIRPKVDAIVAQVVASLTAGMGAKAP
ncbi:MAG: DUF4468 domain-containing protein [Flavobacteriales bacterium]